MKKSMMSQLLEFIVPGEDVDIGVVEEDHGQGGLVEWGVEEVERDATYGSRLSSGSRGQQ